MADHDQRFKVMLKNHLGDFASLFFPDWHELFDLTQASWLDKEVFIDPPTGEKLIVDLVAKLPLKKALAPIAGLAHTESRTAALGNRMAHFGRAIATSDLQVQ